MTGTTPPHRPGTALFWAGLLAFAITTAIASLAVGHRRAPPLADGLRAGLLLALTVGHILLIARAAQR